MIIGMGIVEPLRKRLGAVELMPRYVEMVKTELIGVEYGSRKILNQIN